MLGSNDVRHGIDRVRQYLDEGKLYITADCEDLIREMRGYRWAQTPKNSKNDAREMPQKWNDHAVDALRYLVVSRPENDTGADPAPFNVRNILGDYSTSYEDPVSYSDIEDHEEESMFASILGEGWD
jgi:hypothetical protein